MRHVAFEPLLLGEYIAARGGVLTVAVDTIMVG